MSVSEGTYKQVALEDEDEVWELSCGRLRVKPAMTTAHNQIARNLKWELISQVDRRQFTVGEPGRLRISTGTFYVPDVCVIPMPMVQEHLLRTTELEVYEAAMPFVAEVWSPKTGTYDVEAKLREYQLRGDAEIWRIHPRERTVTVWLRQDDGSCRETMHRAGTLVLTALPNVRIDLDALFP